MKFGLIEQPSETMFASFLHVGTWREGQICEVCGRDTSEMIEPLLVEWEAGSEQVGDFSWCSYTCVVTERVRKFAEAQGWNCDFLDVKIVPPKRKNRRRVGLWPYNGPRLFWMVAKTQLSLNESESKLRGTKECRACKKPNFVFKKKNLRLDEQSWLKAKVFSLKQFSRTGITYLTENGKNDLLRAGFTNFRFVHAGEVK